MKYIFVTTLLLLGLLSSHASTLNRGNGAEPDSLNIHLAQGINSQNILMDMYEGLMTFDAHGQVINGVALNHQSSADSTHWRFELNPKAKWSDGTPVTATDFMAAWQLAYAPQTAAPYRHLLDNIVNQDQLNVQAESPHVLLVKLNQADPRFLSKLVLPIFYPLPTHSKDIKISNGAYSLDEWQIQEKIRLKKNNHFHQAEQVHFKQVNYWVTENQNSELLRFRANELDITETIPDQKIDWLRLHHPKELRISPYYGTFFLGLNLNHKHLNNIHFRQALSQAIDRTILVEKVLKTGQQAAYGILPGTHIPKAYQFDLQAATQNLKASNFHVATDQLEILYNNSDNQKKVALAVAAMWRQNLGLKTKLRNQEWKVFVNTRKGNNKQVFRSGWIADYLDPLNFLNLFHSQSHFNFYAFNQPKYDAIIEQLRHSSDPEQWPVLVQQAEILLSNELPVIPLYHYVSRHMVNSDIKGFEANYMDKHLSRYMSQ